VSEPTYAWEVADDYEARFREYEDKVNTLAADLLEERAQRREVGEALVRVTEERDELTEAIDRLRQRAIEHDERHQKIFEEMLRERADLVDERDGLLGTLTAVRRCCELGATRRHQIETAAILALLDGVPEVVRDWDIDTIYAEREEALRRQRRYRAAWMSAVGRARQSAMALEVADGLAVELRADIGELTSERDEARDEVVRLGRERDEALADVDRLDDVLGEARQQIIRDAKELVRLRTIIVELGAGEAAEPDEQLEALRPDSIGCPSCGTILRPGGVPGGCTDTWHHENKPWPS
jgi:chromosome segregation ATPase